MRLALALVLATMVGCRGSDSATAGTTAASSTGHEPPAATTTGGPMCAPDGPAPPSFEPCTGACGPGEQCISDTTEFAFCSRGCFSDCDCGTVPGQSVRCRLDLLDGAGLCAIACNALSPCPTGMDCIDALGLCGAPYMGWGDSTAGTSSSSGDGSSGSSGTDSGSSGGTDFGSSGHDPSATSSDTDSGSSSDTGFGSSSSTDSGSSSGTDSGSSSGTDSDAASTTGSGTTGSGTSGDTGVSSSSGSSDSGTSGSSGGVR